MAYALVALLLGYLLGTIPFGLLLTRLAGAGDLRQIGSGNIGATNVLRTGRKGLAAATLALDAGKGALAVLLAQSWVGHYGEAELWAGAAVVLGHVFPVWLNFRGGKGVATALGVILALCWPAGLLTLAVWLGVAALLRYSSLAALAASALAPFLVLWFGTGAQAAVSGVLAALIWIRHGENINRLLRGQETKIGQRSVS